MHKGARRHLQRRRSRRAARRRSEEHTSELQSQSNLVCRLLLEKKKQETNSLIYHLVLTTTRPDPTPARSRFQSSNRFVQRSRTPRRREELLLYSTARTSYSSKI